MPDTPLNPDALANLRLLAEKGTRELRHVVLEPDLLHKLLDVAEAAALPEVLANSKPNQHFEVNPRDLNRRGWTCGCEPGNYDTCDECQSACNELAGFLSRPEMNDA